MKNFGGFKNIYIIGLGLIGGSIAIALKKFGFKGKIFGYNRSKFRIDYAIKNKIIDNSYDLQDAPWDSIDLVIISVPVLLIEKFGIEIARFIKETTVVFDVGSVKHKIVNALTNQLKPAKFIGVHPIAGTENGGIENGFAELFIDKRTVITPYIVDTNNRNYRSENIEKKFIYGKEILKVKKFWEDIGSYIEIMDPIFHDFVFSAVSHLPHAVAYSLVDSIMAMEEKYNSELFTYTGGGFRDFTRIAASSPDMWKDIFLLNRKEVLNSIDNFIESIKKLRQAIIDADKDRILEILSESSRKKRSI